MSIDEWLDSPLYQGKPTPTVVQRITELVYKNHGKLEVRQWGILQGGGLYGGVGLEEAEALELIELGGVVAGFALATNCWDRFWQRLNAEVERVQDERKACPLTE